MLGLSLTIAPAAEPSEDFELPSVDVSTLSPDEAAALLARLESTGSWWTRIGDELYGPDVAGDERSAGVDRTIGSYYAASAVELPFLDLQMARVGGAYGIHILHFPEGPPAHLADYPFAGHCGDFDGTLVPLPRNGALLEPWRGRPEGEERGGAIAWGIPDATVQALVDQVDAQRYYADIVSLSGFVSRNTFNPGNDEAREWLIEQFQSFHPSMVVETQPFNMSSIESTSNVIAILPGTIHSDEFLIVGAHYDSLPAIGPTAPGAEDNASGTAGVLEIARIISAAGRQQRTIRFIGFAAEEQGLFGSRIVAGEVSVESPDLFQGALIMDMIAYTQNPAQQRAHVRIVTNETYGAELADFLAACGGQFADLNIFTQGLLQGSSDHAPFLKRGLPATLSVENHYASYPAYHQFWDTPSNVTPSQGAEIVKMNLAAALRLANPSPPATGASSGVTAR